MVMYLRITRPKYNQHLYVLRQWRRVLAPGSGSSGPGYVRTFVRDIVLCSWARHFTLTVSLLIHPGVNVGTGKFNAGGNHSSD